MWKSWITSYYQKGYYTVDQMKVFVSAGWITADDYQTITGQAYVAV